MLLNFLLHDCLHIGEPGGQGGQETVLVKWHFLFLHFGGAVPFLRDKALLLPKLHKVSFLDDDGLV